MNRVVYIDGEMLPSDQAKVSVFDHCLLYGDGIFEGIRVYAGNVFKLKEHINRLFASAQAICLKSPVSPEEMGKIVTDTCKANEINDGYVRLVVTRGKGDLGLDPKKCPKPTIICIADTIILYPQEIYDNGLQLITSAVSRMHPESLSPQIKSCNYLNNILAKIEATEANVMEAIMLNHQGYVAECTGDNIFIVHNNVLQTPPVHAGILRGITRDTVMELAISQDIEVTEPILTRYELYTADECFLTGTAAEIVPVVKIDSRVIGTGKPGEVTRQLSKDFIKLVRQPCRK